MHTCIHTSIHPYMHTYIHACMHTSYIIHPCMHAYIIHHTSTIHTYIHIIHIIPLARRSLKASSVPPWSPSGREVATWGHMP